MVLRWLQVTMLEDEMCHRVYPYNFNNESMICAGGSTVKVPLYYLFSEGLSFLPLGHVSM